MLQTPKGTRDFPPQEKLLRQQILETIRSIFELYGYAPLETPILERYETLTAKYTGGAEILKETFKLRDQGNRLLGLRYDLTVPMCRFVGMNPNLKMPFKRYQIGRVFRDGPVSEDRLREFWQCDVDIIGVKSMLADAEILAITNDVFKKLNIKTTIKINNRKLLNGILEYAGIKENKEEALLSLDKLDKFGPPQVKKELKEKGFSSQSIDTLLETISLKNLTQIKTKIKNQEAQEGIQELKELFEYLKILKVNAQLDLSLARGLAYYTGPIYEIFAPQLKTALAAGGRYDKMIGNFLGTKKEYAATGLAFGLYRIEEVLKTKKPTLLKTPTQLYIIPIKTLKQSLPLAQKLRSSGLKTDLDLLDRGPSKNLEYANALKIPYVLFIGEEELKQNKLKLRNMQTGKEKLLTLPHLIKFLKKS